jgi:hypothetical protein
VDLLAVGLGNQHRGGSFAFWSMLRSGRLYVTGQRKCLVSNWIFLWAETLPEIPTSIGGVPIVWAVAQLT